MYINPVERMKKIHIWIGTVTVSENIYNEYFDQDNNISLFMKDIGINEEYDEDFIGILPLFNEEKDIEYLLNEIPVDTNNIKNIMEKCEKSGINKGNAVVFFTDSSIEVVKPYKDSYNGLKYIGMFNSDL
jgi:hypothetical protein